MLNQPSRRQFLTRSAVGLSVVAGMTRAAPPAEDGLRVGIIGVAGQGAYDLKEIANAGGRIVALCDVDEGRAAKARAAYPEAKFHTDFRRLLDEKGLDAVAVCTPDHTHAVATVAALKAGLHVYCEKPLTRTVSECRIVRDTAAKHNRVTQMGTQIHAGSNYRRVVELVQSGTVGPVREVHVWVGTSYSGGDRPKETPDVPAGLHYDLWLGPAPFRPYHPRHLHFNWRGWWDFGGGALADMACHFMDLPFWALRLGAPRKIAAEGPPVHAESAGAWGVVYYEFPERDTQPPVKLTWYHGGRLPPLYRDVLPKWGGGVLFVGEKGLLVANYSEWKLLPEGQFKDFQSPKPWIPNSIGHHREWLEACQGRRTTTCNFDYSGGLTEAVLLGNVAYRLGRPITWNARELKAVNDAEADRYLQHSYREGWSL